ncbi:MAG: DUF3341 domain-containing protein [Chloroflexi bacterium]|nr:DUF3341 domain-containing protein [Chloroflexota bacterium]
MEKVTLLGLCPDAETAARGVEALEKAGFASQDYEILTSTPYPEGAFGEKPVKHKLFVFPFVGAAAGLSVAVLLTAATQLDFPLVTGGKPILSLPPMFIIAYEATLLGAIIFTVLGIIFESRLPRWSLGLYDRRITQGYIGLLVSCLEDRRPQAEQALSQAGVIEIKRRYPGGGGD